MGRLRLRKWIDLVPLAMLLCAALARGQDAVRGGASDLFDLPASASLVASARDEPFDDAPLDDSAAPPVQTDEALVFDEPDAERPQWGLKFQDAFPLFGCDQTLRDGLPACDQLPAMGLAILVGYDAWRGVSDGSWENNGIHTGANLGSRLGQFSDWMGIGAQVGGTVGVYDFSGSSYRLTAQNEAEVQGFLTYGLFRKATEKSNWSAAIVQDWMFNSNFGVYAQSPTLSQFRAQLGYATSACNEFGVWGAWRVVSDTRVVSGFGSTTWRPLDQVNFYWHHKWSQGGADTWIWIGIPEQHRLADGGSLGDYIANALANCPLSDRVSLYAQVTYMHPSASPGAEGSMEDAWNFTIGIALYPGANARSSTVAGQCWIPQMPVANNGTFLVDTNRTY